MILVSVLMTPRMLEVRVFINAMCAYKVEKLVIRHISNFFFSPDEVTLQIVDKGWPRNKLPIKIIGRNLNRTISQSGPLMTMFSNSVPHTSCYIKRECTFIGWSVVHGNQLERLNYECACPIDVNCVIILMIYDTGDLIICDILLPY